ILTGLLFGLLPAWQATDPRPWSSLALGGRSRVDAGRRGSIRRALVAAQVALSVVLLVGSGLLLRSFVRALDEPVGFNPSRLLAVDLDLGGERYAEPARLDAFVSQALDRIAAIPGIESAAAVSSVPLSGSGADGSFAIEGRTFPAGSTPHA